MFKYLVKALLFVAMPFAYAMDSLPISAGSVIDAVLLNAVTIDQNESVTVVFDPQQLNGEALPDYCLLTAQVILDGQTLGVSAQNLLCITESQHVIEGALAGVARSANQPAITFDCTRSGANGCQRAALAEGLMVQFTVEVEALLQSQR